MPFIFINFNGARVVELVSFTFGNLILDIIMIDVVGTHSEIFWLFLLFDCLFNSIVGAILLILNELTHHTVCNILNVNDGIGRTFDADVSFFDGSSWTSDIRSTQVS